jgi:hypothetical protein
VSLRAGLNDVEKRKLLTLPGLELQPLSRSPHSQSLYRLRYATDVLNKDIKLEIIESF